MKKGLAQNRCSGSLSPPALLTAAWAGLHTVTSALPPGLTSDETQGTHPPEPPSPASPGHAAERPLHQLAVSLALTLPAGWLLAAAVAALSPISAPWQKC